MRRLFLFLILSAVIYSCQTTYYRVEHVNKLALSYQPQNSGVYYYLPLTIVEVDVQIKKIARNPGALSEFAESHIGYSGVTEKNVSYEISDIKMKPTTAPDPQQLYFIHAGKKQNFAIDLASNGLLYNINTPDKEKLVQIIPKEDDLAQVEKERKDIQITLLNLKEKSDTIFTRQILEDGVVVENRQIERVLTKNSKAESAKDAVKMINDIRAQKYSLISYNEELAYPAATLDVMLKELSRLEDEYLTLFLGTTEIQYLSYRFKYIPTSENKSFQPLFKFSPSKGINDSLKLIMETAYIKHDPSDYTGPIEKFYQYDAANKKSQGIAYRMPEKTTLRIVINNQTIATSDLWIAQLGCVQRLPAYNLNKIKLVLDPESGELRHFSIEN